MNAETAEAAIAAVKQKNLELRRIDLNHEPIEITAETPGFFLARCGNVTYTIRKTGAHVEVQFN